jgi:hypothetical protein
MMSPHRHGVPPPKPPSAIAIRFGRAGCQPRVNLKKPLIADIVGDAISERRNRDTEHYEDTWHASGQLHLGTKPI